jgi:hypothetical protein
MSTRGSQFTRTMRYFRESDIDEARAALGAATEIVTERVDQFNAAQAQAAMTPTKIRKQRKPRSTSTGSAVTEGAASQSGGQS